MLGTLQSSGSGDTLRRVRGPRIWALFAVVLPACAGDLPAVPRGFTYPASQPMGPCAAVEQQHVIEGQSHVPECSPVEYETLPPSSGDHYGIWAAFKVYSTPVPEGYWVHDLEHGAVVLSYNCPDGCDADVAAATQMLNELPADPLCLSSGEGVRRRSVMTPDPKLDVEFAASAWGFTLRADCFDPDVFRSFAVRHYAAGPEDLCADGIDLATGVPQGCGAP